ncbi:MAG: phosphoribosylformylglycinamidine synthase subunit PurQ [Bacillota bacterium]
MKFGLIVFPGSNCDADVYYAVRDGLEQPVDYIWHKTERIEGYDCLILPGGFSYGDYLRAGAIARFSPAMQEVARHAQRGGLVLGICNGFQMLLEMGLLPGAMRRNDSLQFRCHYTYLVVENAETPFTREYQPGQVVAIPIAHGEGNYYADEATLAELEQHGQVVFRYCNEAGEIVPGANPNGSVGNIAGITNRAGNVLGMMPHPERCAEAVLGGTDGLGVFRSIESWLKEGGYHG